MDSQLVSMVAFDVNSVCEDGVPAQSLAAVDTTAAFFCGSRS